MRYVIGLAFIQRFGPGFPYGTLAINLLGSFAIGVVAELAESRIGIGSSLRVFLAVGVLGGFTTFSTFSYDSLTLASGGFAVPTVIYVVASVLGGILAAFAGVAVVRLAG